MIEYSILFFFIIIKFKRKGAKETKETKETNSNLRSHI
jgi:hypothetical protein